MSLIDSHITSNRARAERAYQNAASALNVNPEYISSQVNQKPKDYEDDTGVALGAYPIGDGLVQRVSWNNSTDTWEDLGDPLLTAPNGSPGTPSAVGAGKILAVDGDNNTKIIDPNESKWGSKEDAIQEAIDGSDLSNTSQTDWGGANQNGGDTVVLSRNVIEGGYDASKITFDSSVLMEVDGQRGVGYNVRAYGAAGDNSTDDHPAFQAAADQAKARSAGNNVRLYVPETKENRYKLGSQWVIEISNVEVAGPNRFGTQLAVHGNFDATTHDALVDLGGGTTSSHTFWGINIDGRGAEVSALKLNSKFSAYIEHCTLRAGDYNDAGLGRQIAGLHVYQGKNIYVDHNQIATSSGYGILVDNRGDNVVQLDDLYITNNLIEENEGNVIVRNGLYDVYISGGHISAPSQSTSIPQNDHNVYAEHAGTLRFFGPLQVENSTYGIVADLNNFRQFKTQGVTFKAITRQSIVDAGSNSIHNSHQDNEFERSGTDHVQGGSISEDYKSTDHVADIHIEHAFQGVHIYQGNHHKDQSPGDRYAAIISADETNSMIADDEDAYQLIADNVPFDNGYLARNGDVVKQGQAHYMDYETVLFNNIGEEAAGAGNTPTKSKWQEGNFVENTDDDKLYLLLPDNTWYDFGQQISFDKGNDGVNEIQSVDLISSQNDPRDIWSVGADANELLVDGDPIAYREEDETITGQWEYTNYAEHTGVDGKGFSGYFNIPNNSTASSEEFVLISKLDGNANNQYATGDIWIGREAQSSAQGRVHIHFWWNMDSLGDHRSFGVDLFGDSQELAEVELVELTYNSSLWAAIRINTSAPIRWRIGRLSHTGNYSKSIIEAVPAADVSGVTSWSASTEGKLARKTIYANVGIQKLQPDTTHHVGGDGKYDGGLGIHGTSPSTQTSLTAQDGSTIDGTYGTEEEGVIKNNRTRISEIESALKDLGLLS